ncbi:ABC transporter substrate-binding protein [Psittacicella gerlachiana]|uniref:Solute-binding protein family 5 domain-containing protein n=1 Tax=Psittacicella gerlachiana TaxID=2028574 RepID=A0A3A1YGX6_9GAMM|nr:ABC transporter substrate-binding protein [Psittacicella gerlachiana]RIY37493.1 hypothetical protein CKF59_01675 [Psittacicella gerlachiana]
MLKKLIFCSGLIASVLTLSACDKQTASTEVEQNRPLQVTAQWEINSLDPAKVGYVFHALQLVETLVETDSQGNLVPGLALSWQPEEQAKVWVVKLRPQVKFHDGTLLDAQTVKQSLEIALSKPTLLQNAKITQIVVRDALTLEFRLEQSLTSFPAYLAHTSTVILAPSSFATTQEVTQIVGTGPYKVESIEIPQKVTARAFADYWGDKAIIEQVNYLANSRAETRTLLVQSDPSYLVYNLDYASAQRLRANPKVVVQSKPIARTIQLKLNLAHPFLEDVEVRQVLSQAIDRTAIATSLLGIPQGQAYQILPPAYPAWQVTPATAAPDYQALQQKLSQLGWKLNEQQQLVNAQGQEFIVTLRTFPDRAELPLIATALQDQWQKLGIKVNVAIGNASEIASGHQDGSLELALYSRNYGSLPDPTGVLGQDYKVGGADWGAMNWQQAASFQAKLASYTSASTSESEQKLLREQIIQQLNEQLPMIPIVYALVNVAHGPALGGLELDPFERTYYLSKLYWLK